MHEEPSERTFFKSSAVSARVVSKTTEPCEIPMMRGIASIVSRPRSIPENFEEIMLTVLLVAMAVMLGPSSSCLGVVHVSLAFVLQVFLKASSPVDEQGDEEEGSADAQHDVGELDNSLGTHRRLGVEVRNDPEYSAHDHEEGWGNVEDGHHIHPPTVYGFRFAGATVARPLVVMVVRGSASTDDAGVCRVSRVVLGSPSGLSAV